MPTRIQELCPRFQAALQVLSRPWSGLILTFLQDGPLRFSELSAKVQGLGDKMLAARLKELKARGLVARTVHAGPPVRVQYALTRKGAGFRAVVEAIEKWGRELVDGAGAERHAPLPTRGAHARRAARKG